MTGGADKEGGGDISPTSPPLRWFDPQVRPKSPRAVALRDFVIREIEANEPGRQRKRKAEYQEVIKKIVGAVIGEALSVAVRRTAEGEWVSFTTNHSQRTPERYRSPVLASASLVPTFRLLDDLGWIIFEVGHWGTEDDPTARRTPSRFTCGERLKEEAERRGVDARRLSGGRLDADHFISSAPDEVIIMGLPQSERHGGNGLMPYAETPETRRMRREVKAINDWLSAGQMTCVQPSCVQPTPRRALVRRFTNGRFDHGGHLYGGFWQPMPKEDRRRTLRIAGSPIVHVDYSSAYCRLAYALKGVEPPAGDLYAVPGLEGRREVVKRWMAAMFFPRGLGVDVNGRPIRAPQGTREGMPKGMASEEFHRLVCAHHAPIADLFGTDIGFKLMWMTSECTLRALRKLMPDGRMSAGSMALPSGVVALPVFDALVCREQDAETVKAAMLEAFREVSGRDFGKVGVE